MPRPRSLHPRSPPGYLSVHPAPNSLFRLPSSRSSSFSNHLSAEMTRQPTPSHNAAHVLVSFQNESLFPSSSSSSVSSSSSSRKQKGRPLSLANATRPPQNRRRVWRACESCRKKKIKCDGSDPCQCCLDNGSECVYAGDMGRRPFISP